MQHFIVLTFVLLALAFYQASGGADFNPKADRLVRLAQAEASSARAASERRIVRPAPPAAPIPDPVIAPAPEPASFTAPAVPLIRAAPVAENPTVIAAAPLLPVQVIQAEPVPDFRAVRPARVNLRMGPGKQYNVLLKLTRGTEVRVLQDPGEGWVKLRVTDTGRIGWMAGSLLTAKAADG
ncbi:SH3 domain protein [Thalassovita gelatinovora]|uniref:SH3 domain protein n=1 Tax=Thalassovita gelatinovora TaxID=53501 RepID=A0A0P1F8K5_THAGE|nr:SH3 domain-containing protein [Thalassovita gelatinovora]QIZ81384.1 SH3 domain-containing protein [Thalassovita gelatinovora]CUH64405.1 SH3 domain protein [Thalassovita gelatinovora]SER20605.1 SH3 domain-containing protein [Thalassovita gelatinovora]